MFCYYVQRKVVIGGERYGKSKKSIGYKKYKKTDKVDKEV